jgi:glycosyltransferase involved in cell wall biosynthesis
VADYHALFLPTLNENFGHSIVESLMSGCAVIISDQTPWRDLERYRAGFDLPLKEEKAFVNAVRSLAEESQEDFSARSKKAIEYISSRLNTEENKNNYRKMFNGTLENRSV